MTPVTKRTLLIAAAALLPAGLALGLYEQAASQIPPTNPPPTDGRLIRGHPAGNEGDLIGQYVACAKDCYALSLDTGRRALPGAPGLREGVIPPAPEGAGPAAYVSIGGAPFAPVFTPVLTPAIASGASTFGPGPGGPTAGGPLSPYIPWLGDLPGGGGPKRPETAPEPPTDNPGPDPTDEPDPVPIPAPPAAMLMLLGLGVLAKSRHGGNRHGGNRHGGNRHRGPRA